MNTLRYTFLTFAIALMFNIAKAQHYGYEHGAFRYVVVNPGPELILTYWENVNGNMVNTYSGDIIVPGYVNGWKVIAIQETFVGCSELKSVTIPNTVWSVGSFDGDTKLTSVSLPLSVLNIGTFKECISLESISLPEKITSLCDTFEGCTSLKNVSLPSSLESMSGTFYGCTSLTSIDIPQTVIVIGENTFRDCVNIKEINLPEGVYSIGHSAFQNCTNLKSFTIPQNVKNVSEGAFAGCTGLTEIHVKAMNPPETICYYGLSAFEGVDKNNCILYVPAGTLESYKNTWWEWSTFKNIREEGVYPKGDINGDYEINIKDVTTLVNCILGKKTKAESDTDVNGDGVTNISDVAAIINIILNKK